MSRYIIERFIEESNQSASPDEVSSSFGNALRKLGYDRFCYSLLTDHPSMGLRAGHGIARNYPDGWMAHYSANGYEHKDPVRLHAPIAIRPFTWESLEQGRVLKPEQKRVMNEARDAGLLDGIAIPIPGTNGEFAGVGMASSVGGVRPHRDLLSKLHALTLQFHLAYTGLMDKDYLIPDDGGPDIQLTDREKEILLWVAEGKSDFVMADIIGVSHSTIRFHMNNIFKKLNANERTLAAVKAIRLGLIFPSRLG